MATNSQNSEQPGKGNAITDDKLMRNKIKQERTQLDRNNDTHDNADTRPRLASKTKMRGRMRKPRTKQSELGLQILFGEKWHQWVTLSDQLSYVTPHYISQKVAQLALHYYGKESVCWDMFGGMGMDALNLAEVFMGVRVTEVDSRIFKCQAKNLDTFSSDKNNIVALQDDCVKAFQDPGFIEEIDVIHFDPPWGDTFRTGEDFRFEEVRLMAEPQTELKSKSKSTEKDPKVAPALTIIELLDKLYKKVPRMILKSPIKCNSFERWAERQVPPVNIMQVCEFPTHKLKYLYIDKPVLQYPSRTRPRSLSDA